MTTSRAYVSLGSDIQLSEQSPESRYLRSLQNSTLVRKARKIDIRLYNKLSRRKSTTDDNVPGARERRGANTANPSFLATLKLWRIDFLAWVFALSCMLVIVGVLKHWNGQPTAEWSFGISLNALISVLASLAYLFIGVPVSACVAQLKWNLYRKPCRLFEFHLVEEASKSAFGSARLVISQSWVTLPILGAMITLVGQAIGPFLQQVLSQRNVEVLMLNQTATMPILKSLSNYNYDPVSIYGRSAYYRGLLSTSSSDFNLTSNEWYCPIFHCVWRPYPTLAVCSKCTDVTNHGKATYLGKDPTTGIMTIKLTLSNNFSTLLGGLSGNMLQASAIVPSLVFRNETGKLLDFTVVHVRDEVEAIATECMLQLCAYQLSASVDGGTLTEYVQQGPIFQTDTLHNSTYPERAPTSLWTPWASAVDGGGSSEDAKFIMLRNLTDLKTETILVDTKAAVQFASWLLPVFSKLQLTVNTFDSEYVAVSLFTALTSNDRSFNGSALHENENSTFTIAALMDNVARSLTTYLRTTSNDTWTGSTWRMQTQYHVNWVWISLPAAWISASLILLVACIFDTHAKRLEVWRSSSLATLFHGLDDYSKMPMGSILDLKSMEALSKSLTVELVDDGVKKSLKTV